jgi:fibronectin-binding autotransporter adhesin
MKMLNTTNVLSQHLPARLSVLSRLGAPAFLSLLTLAVLLMAPAAARAASTITWNGAAADSIWDNPTNWVGVVAPVGTSGDTAQFDGTQAGALALTWKGTNDAGAPGLILNMLGTQTSPLSIDSDGVTTTGLRLQGLYVNSGAGQLTLGNGVGTWGAASQFAVAVNGGFTNYSAYPVEVKSDVGFGSSGGSARTLTLWGNWNFHNNLHLTGTGSMSYSLQSGIMNYDGVSTAFPNTTLIAIGSLAGYSGVLNFNSGATLVTGGNSPIDAGTAGVGTINVYSGASITPGQYLVAGITTAGAMGTWNIYGGSVTIAGANGGTLAATASTYGTLNVFGGSYSSVNANTASGIFVGENGIGTLNVSGTGTMALGNSSTASGLLIGKNSGSIGVVNLGAVGSGGGTITAMRVQSTANNAMSALNFHGGTLQAATGANTVFLNGLTSANVYGEGAVIDSNGQTNFISQSLLAPAGNGVSSIALSSGGSGYITAPYVTISRAAGDTTGQFATALAQVDMSTGGATSGQVTNILITNPGINYTVPPIVTLTGGNASSAATIGTVTLAANVSGGFTKNGAGTTILGGANTYTNTTTVNAGRLVLTGSRLDSKNIIVADAARLSVAIPTSVTFSPVGLAVGATTGATLDFTVSSTTQAPLTPNTLTLNGANTINIAGGTFVAGSSYPLIAYTTLAGAGSYSAGTLPAGVGGTITTSGNTIYFNVTGVTNTVWTGLVSGMWDIGTTANWTNAAGGNTYTDGSTLLFDDTASNTTTISNSVATTLTPATILVNNSTKNYCFKANTIIAGGGSLTKTGTANLTNSTVNTYTGPTIINQGSLVAGVASTANVGGAVGLNSAVTLANNSTAALNLNGFATQIGSLTGGGPNAGNVVLGAGTLSVGGDNTSPATYAGNISGTGGLTKIGTGTLTLTGTNTATGTLTVYGGTMTYASGTVQSNAAAFYLGMPSGGAGSGGLCTMNVNSGSTITFGYVNCYVGYLSGLGVLNLNGGTFTGGAEMRVGGSDVSGYGVNGYGVVNMNGGNVTFGAGSSGIALSIARGNNNQNSVSGEVNVNSGTLNAGGDVIVGFAGTGTGKININGGTLNVATTAGKWLQFGEYDGTSAEINLTNGNLNLNMGSAIKYNTQNSSGYHTINHYGGAVTFYSDFGTNIGGGGNLDLQYNSSGSAAVNTYSLNGGTLTVPQVASTASSATRVFNFNGGTLKPTTNSTAFFNLGSGSAFANVRNNGAIIDSAGYNITIAQPLQHSAIAGDNAADGGLTKVGNGTLAMTGALTYTGPTRVLGGALSLRSSSGLPYPGGNLVVSNATLALDATSGSMNANNVSVGSTLILTLNPSYNAINASGSVTLGDNTTINLAYGILSANPTAAAINASGSLTRGTNISFNISAIGFGPGIVPLVTVPGLANTNGFVIGSLPSGVKGVLTNSVTGELDLLITSAGQLLSWHGANADNTLVLTNWDINTSSNWYDINNNLTKYVQYSGNTIGDNVIFGDSGYYTDGTNYVNLPGPVVPATVIFSSAAAYSLTGPGGIGGGTSVVLTNDYSSVFLGTSNSYTGGTLVGGGTLIVANDNALGATSGGVTLSGGTLQVNGSTTNNTRAFVVPADSSIGVGAGGIARFGGAVTGAGGLTKTGNGTLILAGTNDVAGSLQVSQGTLTTLGTNALPAVGRIGNTAGLNGVLTVPAGVFGANNNAGQFTSSLIAGSLAGSYGEITVNGGTLNVGQQLALGPGLGGYGALSISSGALNCGSYIVVGFNNDQAVYNQSGGTITLSSNLMTIAAGGTGSIGVASFSGGTFIASHPNSSGIMVGERGSGTMNVSGSASIITTNSNGLLVGPVATQTGWAGTLNLNGGTVAANKINKGLGTGTAKVNFNGGTIRAAANNATFLSGMDVATVYGGGLTVDDGGFTVTIPQTLVQASDAGVSGISISTDSSGYIDSPVVTIGGGSGSNATATATVAGGKVTGIVVTSPGTGYSLSDTLYLTYTGGGASAVPPTTSTVNLANNTSGGLTKQGAGTVTLSGANTYAGTTVISQGGLLLTPAYQAGGAVTAADGAAFGVTANSVSNSATIGSLTMGSSGATTLDFIYGLAGNPTNAVLTAGAVTLHGTCSIQVGGSFTVGAFPVLKYSSLSGSFNSTVTGPRGLSGSVSNDVAHSTIYVVVTSLASPIVWTGTNPDPAKTNVWNLNTITNWLIGANPTTYQETVPPGDAVLFNDLGSGVVLLSNTASPATVTISNSAVNYTFQGPGQINSVAGLTKLGSGTATLNLPGTYSISTAVSEGTVAMATNQTFANLTGGGTVATASGAPTLTVNNSANTTFSGSIQGGLGLTKTGNGTLTLTGVSPFTGNVFGKGGTIVIDSGAIYGGTAYSSIAQDGADLASLTLKGTGSFTNNADFNIGDIGNSTGTLNISNNASLVVGAMYVASANAAGSAATGTVNQASGTVQNTYLVIGGRTSTNAVGVYNMSGGTLTDSSTVRVGGFGTGTLNMSGTASASFASTSADYVGYRMGNGTVNMTGGSFSAAGELRVGGSDLNGSTNNATGTVTLANATMSLGSLTIARGNYLDNACAGTVTLNSGSTLISTNDVIVQFAGTGLGKLAINGGTLVMAPAATKWLMVGYYDAGASELDITSGNLILENNSSIKFSRAGNTGGNVFNQSGGNVTYYSDAGVTIGGTGNLDLNYGGGASSTSTYNLDGGTLTVPQVVATSANGSSTFNFNGGTLKAAASSTTFMQGLTAAYVKTGGAFIDPTNYVITIAQPLLNNGVDEDGGLTKNGNGTLLLNGVNTYTNMTTVNAGTLGGTGTIAGPVTLLSGATLAPGASIGTLTIGGNLTLNVGSTNSFEVNGTTPANDVVALGGGVTYGGTLNIVPTGTFTVGQQFTLFSGAGAVSASNFASVQSSNPALVFSFTNGVLKVVSSMATNPTNITYSVSGDILSLSWPTDHLGWYAQSNSVSVANPSTWYNIPGSENATTLSITINTNQPKVFYRLLKP